MPAPVLPNDFCPVMPDQPADAEYQTSYQGRRVCFCCADCVRRFQADPEAYVGNLPPVPPPQVAAGAKEPWGDYLLRLLSPVFDALEAPARYPWLSGYLLGVVLLSLVAVRAHRQIAAGRRPARWSDRLSRPFARATTFGLLVLAGVCVQLAVLQAAPPPLVPTASPGSPGGVPAAAAPAAGPYKFAWPNALHELPRGLSNIYYRGNDERSDKLFNGGRYRTATFHVSVRTEDGQEVAAGQRVGVMPLQVHCRIVRAPNTALGFYAKERMAAIRLIRGGEADVKPEEVALSVVRDQWEWEAVGPVGAARVTGYEGFRGVWFLGAKNEPHYGVQYVIHLRDGVVLPESVVWMFAIYQSPILDGPTSDGEWFTDRPIPEIPDGKNVTDPKLLGLTRPAPRPAPAK